MPNPTKMNISVAAFFMVVFYYYYFKLKSRAKCTIKDKVAVITGATSGIGEACANRFHELGCHIIVAARNAKKLREIQKELLETNGKVHVTAHELDVSDTESVTNFVQFVNKKYPKGVDILLNNAGIGFRGRIQDTPLSVHKDIMNTNYLGQVDLIHQFLPSMKEGWITRKDKRCIVGVSSTQGKLSIPFRSAYSASKHACQAYYDCLRAEVAECGMRVSLLSPGYVSTKFSLNAKNADGSGYAKMDKGTKDGMSPDDVAMRIVEMIECHENDVFMDNYVHRLGVFIRYFIPPLYYWIMYKRAKAKSGL